MSKKFKSLIKFLFLIPVFCNLFLTTANAKENPPKINAESAILINGDTGQVLYSKNENIIFIDLEAMITGKYISPENIYYANSNLSTRQKKENSIKDDKLALLSLLLYYLSYGTYQGQMNDYIELRNLSLPKQIEREIITYHVILEYTFKEIAKITDKPIGTVLWIYNKAIKTLRNRIGEIYEQ